MPAPSRFPELTRVTVSALRPLRSVSLREPKRRKLRPCLRLTFPVTTPLVEEVKRRVILPRPDRTWFVKLRGPAELVAAQQAAFEAFVRSVRFPGAKP